jgi:hypothetical protein
MRHAQVCLGEIPLRLKMRKAHSADVIELETHQPDASAANRALELLGREVNLFTDGAAALGAAVFGERPFSATPLSLIARKALAH